MTRKDYELIASVFELNRPQNDGNGFWIRWADTVQDMADALAEDNPHFDRDKFLKACGLE